MPTYKRYIMRDGTVLRLFTAKPKTWGITTWSDYALHPYKAIKLSKDEVENYKDLMSLPEWQLIEVEMKIKVKV